MKTLYVKLVRQIKEGTYGFKYIYQKKKNPGNKSAKLWYLSFYTF